MSSLFQKLDLSVKFNQSQHLLVSASMQKAFHVLQMPIVELAEWLKTEIEQNPVLEYVEEREQEDFTMSNHLEEKEIDFEKSQFEILDVLDDSYEASLFSEEKGHILKELKKEINESAESLLPHRISLFEHLMQQAKAVFFDETRLKAAEMIIGNLDERGFLSPSSEDVGNTLEKDTLQEIIKKIQTFDPPGIGAVDVRHSLLLQLELKNQKNSLAYAIIDHHFDDLLHNRMPLLQRKLKCSKEALKTAIQQEISCLDLHPGYRFRFEPAQAITADLILKKEEHGWKLDVNEETLPAFQVTSHYLSLLEETSVSSQEKTFIKRHITAGKWLTHIVARRHQTLKSIAHYLIKKQQGFLMGEERHLTPMSMQEIARELGLHESTIARAIAHKYLFSPQGLVSLRSFFSTSLLSDTGEGVSSTTIKQLLSEWIQKEDKKKPLSDQLLSLKINKIGIPCARRTVAKYRQALKIAPASQRRKWD
jgi:RNA polymerase sigma-54 factor